MNSCKFFHVERYFLNENHNLFWNWKARNYYRCQGFQYYLLKMYYYWMIHMRVIQLKIAMTNDIYLLL